MEISTSKPVNINKQQNLILGKAATMAEFQEVYDTLMRRNWVVEFPRNKFHVINLADRGWTWGYDNRKTSIGGCKGRRKHIVISKYFCDHNLDHRAHDLEDTIRHEIAHALDRETRGTSDHGPFWQSMAKQVGAIPRARSKSMKKGGHKWTLECPNCGRKIYRHKLTQRARTMACGACCTKYNGGKYTSKYQFNVIQNH